MKILAVDFGLKRIGLACGRTESGLASPLPNLAASGTLRTDAKNIAAVAAKQDAELVVIGVPVMEDASDSGRMQRICRTLASHVESEGLRTALVDESMTSEVALAELTEMETKAAGRKRAKDALAAILIFERYLTNGEIQD